jgi:MFS family permease
VTLFAPLRHREIRLLWIGQALSSIGDQCFSMAVLWIAAQRGGSDVGLVGAAQYASALVFGVFGGVFADR